MKKILIIILSLICFNLFGCSVITTTNNDNNKKGGSVDITTTVKEESKVYDLVKDLNKYDLKDGDVFYNENLMYYISDKKTGDVIESYKIFYKNKNYTSDILYSLYKYDNKTEHYYFQNVFYYNVWFYYQNGFIDNYTIINESNNKYNICLDTKNKYEKFNSEELLHCFPDNNLVLMKLVHTNNFEITLYINSKLQSNTNYEFLTIEETKDKIIVQCKELNSRLIYKEYDINDYYLDIVHNISDEPNLYILFDN